MKYWCLIILFVLLSVQAQLHLIALGLAVTYVDGLVAHIYTQDTPLEKWVRGTRFGQKPANWSQDYDATLVQFYKALFPI